VLSSIATTGCPMVGGVLEGAEYPKEIHERDWTPPDRACGGAKMTTCPDGVYVNECYRYRPAVVWQGMNYSAEQVSAQPVEHLTATGEPACEVVVRDQWIYVRGRVSGVCHVHVAYDHPVTHEHFEHVLDASFSDPPEPQPLRPQFTRPESVKCPRSRPE
jgi:hypothetical protein